VEGEGRASRYALAHSWAGVRVALGRASFPLWAAIVRGGLKVDMQRLFCAFLSFGHCHPVEAQVTVSRPHFGSSVLQSLQEPSP
jgi:hypothetical protein